MERPQTDRIVLPPRITSAVTLDVDWETSLVPLARKSTQSKRTSNDHRSTAPQKGAPMFLRRQSNYNSAFAFLTKSNGKME
jgi:hypothetical protein